MAYTDKFEGLQTGLINVFGTPAILFPQSSDTPVPINGIISRPAMFEEVNPLAGVSVVRFFVRFLDIDPLPVIGDTLQITGDPVTYDIFEVLADAAGGAMLKLRKTA